MKIYITGSVGSGKTTFAVRLAQKLDIVHFETDNFVWERQKGGDIRNSDKKRDSQLAEALQLPDWIIEGVHIDWTDPVIDQADCIIFLDIPLAERKRRIIKRFFKQKLRIEKANYRPSLKMFCKMFQWNRYFEEEMKPQFLKKFLFYPEKVIIAQTVEEAAQILMRQWSR